MRTSLFAEPQYPHDQRPAMEILVLISCFAAVSAHSAQVPSSISVQVTTWNVNEMPPPDNLSDVLVLERDPDLLVLGLQEVFPYVQGSVYSRSSDRWRLPVTPIMKKKGYEMDVWRAAPGINMGVFQKSQLNTSDLYGGSLSTHSSEYNTGGDWLVLTLYGRRIMFLNARFPSGEDNLHLRLEDFHIIENRTNQRHPDVEYTFWFGDLNFRLKDQNELTAEKIAEKIAKGQENELLEKDELRSAMKEGKVFQGYSESEISFKPTYKFELGTSRYDLSRRPAWTDRVLYRAAPGRDITPVYYGSIPHLKSSDHKPVEAFFRITLGPK